MFATPCYTVRMASYFIRQDSPFYWIRYRRPDGTWGQRSSKVRCAEKGALRKIHHMVAEETSAEVMSADDGSAAMFDRWVPGWINYKYTNPGTRLVRKNMWAHLAMFFHARKVFHPQEITYSLCHDYARWRTSAEESGADGRRAVCMSTVAQEIKALGAIMQEAVRRGWCIHNPCHRVGIVKNEPKPKRAISKVEEKTIMESLLAMPEERQWMADAFLVGMRQGCRLTEVAVPLDQIDTKGMNVTFRVKGGKFHAAPLHKDLLPLVKRAIREKRTKLVELPPDSSGIFLRFFKGLGMNLCFHCTRVTVVTRLCEAGFSESQTMAYVGHSTTLVHALYRKMRPVAVACLGDVL